MRAKKICIAFICLIFLGSAAATVLIYTRPSAGDVIEILQDNAVLYTIDLSDYDGPEQLVIESPWGSNTVHIENGCVYMAQADCADHTCVEMGALKSGYPIVCLPHKLVIRYADRAETDAVSR